MGSIEDAYEITYTTKVTRPEGGGTHTINNKAEIILDDKSNDVTDSFTGTWSGDIPIIEKTGNSTNDPHVIDWQIEYNYGKENLGVVSLTDKLSHGEIDLSTINVYQVNPDVDGKIDGEGIPITITPVKDADGNVTFPGLAADGKAYYITFSSKVPVGLKDVTVTNTITDDLDQPNSDNATVNVNTIPKGGKVGEQLVDENGNPYIEWTITMNSSKVDVGSITVRDVFNQEYLEFDTTDTSLFELRLITNGEYEVVNDKIEIAPYTHYEPGHAAHGYKGFKLDISDAGPNEYRFVYKTYYTVAGMQESNLANHAELVFQDGEGEGIGEPVDVEYGLTGPKAGIRKHGKYVTVEENTEQVIEWTINVNNSKILLKVGSTITEEFTSGNFTYIAGSLTATKEDGTALAHGLVVDTDNMGFVLTLNEATNQKFTIKFRTTVDDTTNLKHYNKATLKWEGGEEEDTATVHKRDAGLNKYGNVVINEDGSKTVKWTIDFNTNKHVLHDFKLVDSYTPKRVTVFDIKITAGGVDVTDQFTISTPANGTFTVEKDKLDAVQYQLTYSTTLSPAEEQEVIKNTADITYTGGSDKKDATIQSPTLKVEKQANSIINEEGQDNPYISWTINANTDGENNYVNLVDAVLTDTIPLDQKLVLGSIKVYKIINSSQEDEITGLTIDEKDNSFSIPLPNGPYQYRVKFETEILQMPSLDAEVFDRYNNSTTLTNQTKVATLRQTDDASAWIRYYQNKTNDLTSKTGKQNPETENIDYEVIINPEGLTIHNAKIKDTLSSHHHYIGLVDDEGKTLPIDKSIIITDADGIVLTKDEDYVITLGEDNRSFEISFVTDANEKGTINSSYTITYSTRLNANLVGTYNVTNTIVITGGEKNTELQKTSKTTSAQQWFYGGGGSGKVLNFTMNKEKPNGDPLSQAKFKIERLNYDGVTFTTIIEEIVTDGSSVDLINYRAGRYRITETVPAGYQDIEPIYLFVGYTNPKDYEYDKDNNLLNEYTLGITNSSWENGTHNNVLVEGTELRIVNYYKPVTVEPFEVSKKLVISPNLGELDLDADQFEFELVDSTGNVVAKAKNDSAGNVTFEAQSFDEPGTYNFTIREVDGHRAEITYDTSEFDIVVEIVEGAAGLEVESVTYPETPMVFTNLYTASGSWRPEVSKVLSAGSRLLTAGEFNFEISGTPLPDGYVTTVSNDADGKVVFGEISYTHEDIGKTYTYTIKELAGSEAGMDYDPMTVTISVLVEDGKNGELTITPTYPEDTEFNNSYTASGSWIPEVSKVLTAGGRDLAAGEFDFEISGTPLPDGYTTTVSNDADGKVVFGVISYTQEDIGKTYTYTIKELAGNEAGMGYDDMEVEVTVEVVDAGNGVLTVTPTYPDDTEFNNIYTASGSWIPEVSKVLTAGGRVLRDGEFSFEILLGDDVVGTATNDADGKVVFGVISYTPEDIGKTYTYTIKELVPDPAETNMTYDDMEVEITVTVIDAGNGILTVTPTYSEDTEFNNSYTASGSWSPEVSKVLSAGSRLLTAGEFDFEISGTPLPDGYTTTVSNDADGKVVFGEISYTHEDIGKTYTYTIVEVAGSEAGMDYDPMTVTISVLVEDGKNGELTITPTYPEDTEFNNSYTASGSWIPEVSKVLTAGGRDLAAGEFSFEISGPRLSDEYTTIVSNAADGKVVFEEISYTPEDIGETYTYTIKELVPNPAETNMTYDVMEVEIEVTVVDAGNGVLTVTPTYPNDTEFNNSYTASGSWSPEVSKVLTAGGRDLTAGEFSFEISGTPLPDGYTTTVSNDVDGKVVFGVISYTQEDIGKTYTYTIVEIAGSEAGMDYDPMTVTISVLVEDGKDGELTITPTYPDDTEFNNTYTASGSWIPEVSKVLTAGGRELTEGEFSFEISGTPLPDGYVTTVSNDADGKVVFGEINYTQEDIGETYTYTIRELVPNPAEINMTYDVMEVEITVTVVDAGDGVLTVTPTYSDDTEFNNSYTASGSWSPEVTKVLTAGGRDLTAGEFNFEISGTPLPDGYVTTVSNDADGKVVFGEISYTHEDIGKTYTYTIKELAGSEAGMDYDPMTVTISVLVEDGKDGELTITPTYPDDTEFNNTYTASGSWSPEVSKVLTAGGRDLTAGEFNFEISGTPLPDGYVTTVSNDADGKVVFGEIDYTQADIGKTYTYTIKELVPNPAETNMTYDDMEVEIEVTVVDAGNGKLTVAPTYPEDTEFNNSYTASGSWSPEVTKVLTAGGRDLTAGEFSFEISGTPLPDGYVTTVSNDADGKVVFGEISYTHEDIGETYTYTVVEIAGSEEGMDYDPMTVTISVLVEDGKNGELTITPTYPEDTEFNNSYTASGTWSPEITKVLEGRDLNDGEFKFEIKLGDVVVSTGTNDVDGNVVFEDIIYSEEDINAEYIYTITEVLGELGGITYDNTLYEAVVTITDDGEGVLIVEVDYVDGSVEFNNTYTTDPDSVVLEASKILEGQELRNGQFTFELVDADSKVIQTVTNDVDGQVIFSEISYDEIGEYSYSIREVKGSQGGVTYDETVYEVVVTVTDNGQGNLVAIVDYVHGLAVFTNTYVVTEDSVVLEATKVLKGQELEDGQFTFELVDADGKIIQTVTNNADGLIVFDELVYNEAGESNYTIREVNDEQDGITYDETVYEVVVTVTDDGEGTLTAEVEYVGVDAVEFENTYSETSGEGVDKPDLPETGSSNNMLLSLMGFVLMIGGLFLVKKRPE